MVNRGNPSWAAAALVCALGAIIVLAPRRVRADEIKLKDGTKITGTIVGFEENSFKVKTSYGFAVVQKDQVVSIIVSDTSKKASAGSDQPVPERSTAPPAKPAKAEVAAVTPAPVVAAVKPASAPAPPPPAPPKPAAP